MSDVLRSASTHGHTSKDIYSKALRGYWMPSREPAKSDVLAGIMARESKEPKLLARLDDDNDDDNQKYS